jgi:hypothetical protein
VTNLTVRGANFRDRHLQLDGFFRAGPLFFRRYDAEVSDPISLLRNPVVTTVAGAGALAADGVAVAYRTAIRLPVVGSRLSWAVGALSRRGDEVLTRSLDPARATIAAIAVQLVNLVLDELDLTELVRERVDVDGIVRGVDIDAIIARIDMIGLANIVIDGVDLPSIIRESTTSVTADVMDDVRGQGERADDLVSGIFDRMLGRTKDLT